MHKDLALESDRLRKAWRRYDAGVLDHYLVADTEDPRINLQSIISRSFLIDTLFPDEFTGLIREEFRFSICLNFILGLLKTSQGQVSRLAIFEALENGAQTCSGAKIPIYLQECFELISRPDHPIPDYISQALMDRMIDGEQWLPGSALSTFEQIWQNLLCRREVDKISVLEPACGSANDYRYLHSFGVSRFLDYAGFDICHKNIANARRRFPGVNFAVGNVLEISAESKSFDYLFIHDLFEHLSPVALDLALSEIYRVTRRQACLDFFNLADIEEHVFKPAGLYHWNTLSLNRIRQFLMKSAGEVDVVHIDTFLKDNYNCDDYHNKEAYTLIISFEA